MRFAIHCALHVLMPAVVARAAYAARWRRTFLILLATNLVDLDHLLSDPIMDPLRCSLGNHLLHTWPACLLYGAALIPRQTRIIAVGLLLHMSLDGLDCLLMRLL